MDITDETLMALADGEIADEAAHELKARIAADPVLGARYALYTRTARLAHEAALGDPDATVSAELTERIRAMAATALPPTAPDNVIPLRPAAAATGGWRPMAIAASLALAVGLSAGLFLSPGAQDPEALAFTDALQDRLARLPSGSEVTLDDGRRLEVVASFTDGSGAFCREYEIGAAQTGRFVGVACQQEDGWALRFAVAGPADTGGFVPASSLEVLDTWYGMSEASGPLSIEEESAFLK